MADGRGAEFLLGHTGELQLTDAQVVRLAAIARREEARRVSMRAAMDSARSRFGERRAPADSAARRQFAERMRAEAERARDQSRADQRDAIAVLTADQQARAWNLVSARGAGRGRGMDHGVRRGFGGMRRGFGGMRRPPAGRPDRDRRE